MILHLLSGIPLHPPRCICFRRHFFFPLLREDSPLLFRHCPPSQFPRVDRGGRRIFLLFFASARGDYQYLPSPFFLSLLSLFSSLLFSEIFPLILCILAIPPVQARRHTQVFSLRNSRTEETMFFSWRFLFLSFPLSPPLGKTPFPGTIYFISRVLVIILHLILF